MEPQVQLSSLPNLAATAPALLVRVLKALSRAVGQVLIIDTLAMVNTQWCTLQVQLLLTAGGMSALRQMHMSAITGYSVAA